LHLLKPSCLIAVRRTLAAAFVALLIGPGQAVAEAPSTTPLPNGPGLAPVSSDWRPPVAKATAPDWLQLTTGEWVKGSLDRFSGHTFYFDSDQFDDQQFDSEDVSQFRSSSPHTYRIEGKEIRDDLTLSGPAAIRDGILKIESGGVVHAFPQEKLISMVKGLPTEKNFWSGQLSFGLTTNSGNSDQFDASFYGLVTRTTPLTRLEGSYRLARSASGGSTTASNQRFTAQFDYYLTRRFFLVLPAIDGYQDRFQNTELRLTSGVGLGYELIDKQTMTWRVGANLAYQYTAFDNVPAGQNRTQDDAAIGFTTEFEYEPSSNLDWTTRYLARLVATDISQTNQNLTSILSFDIWGPLDLDLTIIWDRTSKPPREADGTRPKSDDFRTTVGLSVDF
jgi:putative salt-induced outer membrane protein YdiY